MDVNNVTMTGHVLTKPTTYQVGQGKQYSLIKFKMVNQTVNCTQEFLVQVWGTLGEQVLPELVEGARIAVVGVLELHPWTAKNGDSHTDLQLTARQIVVLDKPNTADLPVF